MKKRKKPRTYPELLIHREHYLQLLHSGRVNPRVRPLIHWYIGKLTTAIDEQSPVEWLAPVEN